MTSSRTLVFLVLVSFYGLILLSLTVAAQTAAPSVALSPDTGVAAMNPAVPPTVGYRTFEVEGLGGHLLETGHFVQEEDGAVVTRLMGDLLGSHVPKGN